MLLQVPNFGALMLGPLLKHPLVLDSFQPPATLRDPPDITTSQVPPQHIPLLTGRPAQPFLDECRLCPFACLHRSLSSDSAAAIPLGVLLFSLGVLHFHLGCCYFTWVPLFHTTVRYL